MPVSKELLSGSAIGESIVVSGYNLAGAVPVHISAQGTTAIDEVWLYGYNFYGSNVPVSIWWGGTGNGNVETFFVPGNGRQLLYDGRLITNGGTILATTIQTGTYAVMLDGFVNNIQ